MQTFTKNEQRIFNALAKASMEGRIMGIEDFDDELTPKQLRGVISSLIQKGKVEVDTPDHPGSEPDYWPIHSVYGPCFWCDNVEPGEEEFITDDEVA